MTSRGDPATARGAVELEPAVRSRLGAVAARYELPQAAVAALETIVAEVAGQAVAPTAIRDPAAIVDRHIADSLVALEVADVRGAATIADLGAGAGFPGLPLAVALPEASVALVESNARKSNFIVRLIQLARIQNAKAIASRVESWSERFGGIDVVTARALAPLPVVVEYAAPLLRAGGALVAWTGRTSTEEDADARAAAQVLGLALTDVMRVTPYAGAANAHLQRFVKVRDTPARFPRRPGVARKRPLSVGS